MKVVLEIAGGLAPSLMGRRYSVDAALLDETQRHALAELVDAAAAEPRREPAPTARDLRSFEIRVAHPKGDVNIVAYDGAIPPATNQLIDMIKSLSQGP
jgi:hypothetical protein